MDCPATGEYPESAIDRVTWIQQMFAAGLASDTIARLLSCTNDTDGSPNATATPFLVDNLVHERKRIGRALEDMHRACAVLDEIISSAGGAASEQ
ncbi:hypothetical protein [Nocardia sp. NPDC004604]|uniref:hypothetical protein n=1 Tax=Nocardia sp. NPDC004604 TaxID=3157013 RepID=UPI0033A68964